MVYIQACLDYFDGPVPVQPKSQADPKKKKVQDAMPQ